MGWKMLATVLLAASTGGCAAGEAGPAQTYWPCEGSFRISSDLAERRPDIEIAMNRWNEFLGFDYFRESPDGKCTITSEALGESVLGEMQGHSMALDSRTLERCQRAVGPALQFVVMHELGHAMGMGHAEGAAIMIPSVGCNDSSALPRPNSIDREECVKAGMCLP